MESGRQASISLTLKLTGIIKKGDCRTMAAIPEGCSMGFDGAEPLGKENP